MAERTRKVRMLDAPDHGTLDIELRYLHNKDMRASFVEDAKDKEQQFLERFAAHAIASWSAGEYTAAVGLAWLIKVRELNVDVVNELIARSTDKAAFGIPRLVDPAELGNE